MKKTVLALVWGVIVIGCLVSTRTFDGLQKKYGRASACEQSTSKIVAHVSLEEAREISFAFVATFVGKEKAQGIRYLGRHLRKAFPPFVMCYVFEIPLGVRLPSEEVIIPDDDAPGRLRVLEVRPEKPLTAEIWVDEESGRVLTYHPDYDYKKAKYLGKEPPKESDLISETRAIEIAKKVVELARVPMEGMRLTTVRLDKPQPNYFHYTVVWEKYAQVPGVGEVQFPTSILLNIDALTGELDLYLFKEFPVVITLTPPKVPKGRAIEVARGVCPLQEIQETEAHLKIDFDPEVPNWKSEYEVKLYFDAPPRFYREIGMKRQALIWWVTFKGKFTPPSHLVAPGHVLQPKDAEWSGIVNATTGRAREWYLAIKD